MSFPRTSPQLCTMPGAPVRSGRPSESRLQSQPKRGWAAQESLLGLRQRSAIAAQADRCCTHRSRPSSAARRTPPRSCRASGCRATPTRATGYAVAPASSAGCSGPGSRYAPSTNSRSQPPSPRATPRCSCGRRDRSATSREGLPPPQSSSPESGGPVGPQRYRWGLEKNATKMSTISRRLTRVVWSTISVYRGLASSCMHQPPCQRPACQPQAPAATDRGRLGCSR